MNMNENDQCRGHCFTLFHFIHFCGVARAFDSHRTQLRRTLMAIRNIYEVATAWCRHEWWTTREKKKMRILLTEITPCCVVRMGDDVIPCALNGLFQANMAYTHDDAEWILKTVIFRQSFVRDQLAACQIKWPGNIVLDADSNRIFYVDALARCDIAACDLWERESWQSNFPIQ